MRQAIIRSGLEILYFTRLYHALQGFAGGIGAILTLHHVRPARRDTFQPNRLLEVTPEFLEDVLGYLQSRVDIVSLDEMHRRLSERDFGRRFVCLTFDDGYRDNQLWAYPVLQRYRAPFAVYVPTSFPAGEGDLWWLTLQEVIAKNERIAVVMGGEERLLNCATPFEKQTTFDAVYWWLRRLPTESELRAAVQELAQRYSIDATAACSELCMTWNELAELAADPLVTIGAHSVNHVMLKKVPDDELRCEMQSSAAAIETKLGRRPRHFSYPVGDSTSAGPREFRMAQELGFITAVTTRPGVLFPEHCAYLTALPRISLNGEYQRLRYVDVLTSGAATAVWNGFRRVDAA
jgi:peptidoglycan/xylan/chitin deacetylase (PgdA/CDA1 family)